MWYGDYLTDLKCHKGWYVQYGLGVGVVLVGGLLTPNWHITLCKVNALFFFLDEQMGFQLQEGTYTTPNVRGVFGE